jgi:hypothetical protein
MAAVCANSGNHPACIPCKPACFMHLCALFTCSKASRPLDISCCCACLSLPYRCHTWRRSSLLGPVHLQQQPGMQQTWWRSLNRHRWGTLKSLGLAGWGWQCHKAVWS